MDNTSLPPPGPDNPAIKSPPPKTLTESGIKSVVESVLEQKAAENTQYPDTLDTAIRITGIFFSLLGLLVLAFGGPEHAALVLIAIATLITAIFRY